VRWPGNPLGKEQTSTNAMEERLVDLGIKIRRGLLEILLTTGGLGNLSLPDGVRCGKRKEGPQSAIKVKGV